MNPISRLFAVTLHPKVTTKPNQHPRVGPDGTTQPVFWRFSQRLHLLAWALGGQMILAWFTGPSAFAASPIPAHEHAVVYQCSMHPWIKSSSPGKCTICGMELVAISGEPVDSRTGTVTLSSSQISTIGVETVVVARQPLTRTLRVAGRIDDDDTRHRILSARVPGRIEHLNVTYTGEKVAAGAPLATIYSPEMLSAQRIYVERLKAGNLAFAAAELSAARERIQELGLSPEDLLKLDQSREPSALIVVRAQEAGTIVSKSVYEGQYVQTSDRLFEIADFSQMWFVFDLYEQDTPWVRVGQRVEITTRAVPGEVIKASIAFIDPNFDEATRTTKARAVIPNPHPGVGDDHVLPHRVLAEGRVLIDSPGVLTAPRSSVLDSGLGPVAYVDLGNNRYEQRRLTLGRRGDGLVEILSGLHEGDKVVTNGSLLIDAQAQLTNQVATEATSIAVLAPPPPARILATAPAPAPAPYVDSRLPLDQLRRLASAAIDGATSLANDDFAGYQRQFAALHAAADGFALPALELGTDLTTARRSFEPWSTAAADLLKPYRAQLGVKIFECPMSPILKKGRWVQRGQPLKNPFFGSAMADCGEELP